jgi:poly(A) polymerase
MATPESKPLGVTAPLSTALPTESENQASSALIEELKKQNNYESHADTQKRYVAPAELALLCTTASSRFQRASPHVY